MYIYLECMREEILYSDGHRGYRFKRVNRGPGQRFEYNARSEFLVDSGLKEVEYIELLIGEELFYVNS